GWATLVGAACVVGAERQVGVGELSLDVVEIVIAHRELRADLAGQLEVDAALSTEEKAVAALEFVGGVVGEVEARLEDGEGPGGEEGPDRLGDGGRGLEGETVEHQIVVPHDVGAAVEGILEAARGGAHRGGTHRAVPAEEGLVEPESVLIEVAAEGLVGAD